MALNKLAGFALAPSVANGERSRISANLLETVTGNASTPPALENNPGKKEEIRIEEGPETAYHHQGGSG